MEMLTVRLRRAASALAGIEITLVGARGENLEVMPVAAAELAVGTIFQYVES